MKSNLTIYSASAGSGKTYTLAKRYIELLLENPLAYKETLAVTFTNKATEEMKMRILEQLYDQSLTDPRAGKALSLMLHDYSMFQVQTIDAFFQRVMRNLARELDLTANLRVDLNDYEREALAVDTLVSELGERDEKLQWILSFSEDKMRDDKSWDVINDIKEFGRKIFSDEYKENAQDLQQCFSVKGFFGNLRKQLRDIKENADNKMAAYAKEFEDELANAGYSIDDFSHKASGAASYFIKLKSGLYTDKDTPFGTRPQAGADGPEGWVGKKKEGTPIYEFARDILVPLINRAEEERKVLQPKAASAKLVLQNLNQLRLLYYISQKVREMNTDENSIQLSDTQNVLNALMKDTDAPFVFEKIGARLKNIMIDEFQDTSTTQWKNFKKLIMECLSQSGSRNLVVGDIKQSIYRWRNGDWKLLHELKDDEYLSRFNPETITLDTNWRSERRIIQFNNAFFTAAAPLEMQHLVEDGNQKAALVSEIYRPENVCQKVSDSKVEENGYVSITLLPSNDYQEETVNLVKEQINEICEAGGKDEDIAILVRNNSDITFLAQRLQEEMPDHRFVSDEAFRLYSSPDLSTIVDAMRLLLTPTNSILLKQLEPYKPQELLEEKDRLLSLPLVDLCYDFVTTFNIKPSTYLSSFFDHVTDFCQQNIPDLQMFVNQWDEIISQKSVQGGEIRGIRLLTIHKSKGLEYENVIIPFCDWLMYKGSTVWCKTDIEPFSSLPIIPVPSNALKGTIYSEEYHEEHLQDCIDNMNLLYVAFTRASRNLLVIGKQPSKSAKTKSSRSIILQEVLPQLDLEGSKWEDYVFTYGELTAKRREERGERRESNILRIEATPLYVEETGNYKRPEFIQSNASKRFMSEEKDEEDNKSFITMGIVMHNLLSEIHGLSEAESKLDEFVQSGVVSREGEGLSREKMAHLIETRLLSNKNELVRSWFAEDINVMNECSILCKDSEGHLIEKRPDRVIEKDGEVTVIDFKFSTPKPEHEMQVHEYMSLISEMGKKNVKGYLWYVYQNKVQEVQMV